MRAILRISATILAVALAVSTAQADPRVVLELFQSQGCSSCPPANANVNALTGRNDILVLSFGVTYWDRLGWKDTFAKPEFTQRQYAYARGLGRGNVYTPQVVLNGRLDVSGIKRGQLQSAIRRAGRVPEFPLSLRGGELALAEARASARPADVWLVRYDPLTINVPIQAGENGGRTLPHRNIVRELVRLGTWRGKATTYRFPRPQQPGLRTAILVQERNGGPIVAALAL